MKIFILSEDETWFGETLEAIYAEAEKETGLTAHDYAQYFKAVEIPEKDWDTPKAVTISEDGEPQELGSYRDALELAMVDGTQCGLLCGSE